MSYGVPLLAPALNRQATDLIMRCVFRHPQDWSGARILIADAALQKWAPEGAGRSRVGLCELAQVNADGDRAARRINRMHEALGIDKRVTAQQAHIYVYTGAVNAIQAVYETTVCVADRLQVALPGRLQQAHYGSGQTWVSPAAVWDQALRLDDALCEHRAMRSEVVADIGLTAQQLRDNMHAWHDQVVADYRSKAAAAAH
jgi:hypothetical protein